MRLASSAAATAPSASGTSIARARKPTATQNRSPSTRNAATPASIVDRIYRDLLQALASNEVKSYMATAGIEIVGSTPAEFGAFFRTERDQWAKVIRETGAKAD